MAEGREQQDGTEIFGLYQRIFSPCGPCFAFDGLTAENAPGHDNPDFRSATAKL